MPKSLFLRIGFSIGFLLLLPLVPIFALVAWNGGNVSTGTPAGGFGAKIDLVYMVIIGAPFILAGVALVLICGIVWAVLTITRRRATRNASLVTRDETDETERTS